MARAIKPPAKTNHLKKVAILDAGGQYVDLVVKVVNRLGYATDLLPMDTPMKTLGSYGAIIMSGSPVSSYAKGVPKPDPAIWQSDVKFLGICYGMQALAKAHGGWIETAMLREDGPMKTQVDTTHPLFKGIPRDMQAMFTHGDFVTNPGEGVVAIGEHDIRGEKHVYSAIGKGNFVGVQFHPEVFEATPDGYQMFRNFLEDIAGLEPDQELLEERMEHVIERKRAKISEMTNGRHVIAFVSGGVDSSVTLALAAPEIEPDKLHAYYIDSGFMRDEDSGSIGVLIRSGTSVQILHAAEQFSDAHATIEGVTYGPLSKMTDPQIKRRIIGKTFIDIQNKLLQELELTDALLLQGTTAADRIESGYGVGGHTQVIKTHHNQVAEVKELEARGLLLEPLADLHKNEIRELGQVLGLPADVVERQPFPGPGLAVRILCHDEGSDAEFVEQDTKAAIAAYVASRADMKAYMLPVRSVGVGGDTRSHLSPVALYGASEWSVMHQLAAELPSRFRDQLNRVIYALGETPLDNITLTQTLLTPDTIAQARHADAIVFEEMRDNDLLSSIKQFATVLLPLSFDKEGGRSIVLRPITSVTYLVSQAMLPTIDLPEGFIEHIAERILQEVVGITQVFLDLTNKPPATTEWE